MACGGAGPHVLLNAQIAAPLVAEFVQKKRRFVQETAIDMVVLKPTLVAAAAVGREGRNHEIEDAALLSKGVCNSTRYFHRHGCSRHSASERGHNLLLRWQFLYD